LDVRTGASLAWSSSATWVASGLDRDVVDREEQRVAARQHVAVAAQPKLELAIVADDLQVRVVRGDEHALLPRGA